MPNKDPNNKNISIHASDEFKKRMDDFIKKTNKGNDLDINRMTVRSLMIKAGNEYIDKEENK